MNIWQAHGAGQIQQVETPQVELVEGWIEYKRITSIMRRWLSAEGIEIAWNWSQWTVTAQASGKHQEFFSYSDALQCALNLLDEMQVVE